MFKTMARFFITALIIAATPIMTASAPTKKNTQVTIKFKGTVIDNKFLKLHKDSLALFLPRLTTEEVYNNIAYGYSLYTTDGKLYNLCGQTSGCIWNDIKNPKGGTTMPTLKISGNARKVGDSLLVLDFVVLKNF